jgi:hypothetical protein
MESQAEIVAALAQGDAEERERAYATVEGTAVRGGNAQAVALAVACVKPLVALLCAPAAKVNPTEWVRASLLLYDMGKVDRLTVTAELFRKNDEGVPLYHTIWTAPDNVFAAMLAKDPSAWTRDDAVIAAVNMRAGYCAVVGFGATCQVAGVDELEAVGLWAPCAFSMHNPQPADRYAPLALLCLDLVRSETDSQPEGVIAGAGFILYFMTTGRPPVAKAVWDAGFLDVFCSIMERYNPMERIGQQDLIPSGMLAAFRDVVESSALAGVEVVQPLLDAGAVDVAISVVAAYQMMNRPEATSVTAMLWGGLYTLEVLLGSPQAELVAAKLRSAGVDSFRYLLDHALVQGKSVGIESSVMATKVAALVWGRDDDRGGLSFKQQDIDKVVEAAGHRGAAATWYPMAATHGQAILSLCVSDINKNLLLASEHFLTLAVDSLLLDPEHPRMNNAAMQGTTDWEAVKAPVQRDFAEAFAQLAMYGPGREVLLQDQSVVEALQRVAAEGWTDEAKLSAESALLAMSDRQPEPDHAQQGQKHIMLSYQWAVQDLVKRVVGELQARRYRTWFGK